MELLFYVVMLSIGLTLVVLSIAILPNSKNKLYLVCMTLAKYLIALSFMFIGILMLFVGLNLIIGG